MSGEPPKTTVKKDAEGAMAPSQGDSHADGLHSANPAGDRDATRKPDDHSAPKEPVTDWADAPKDGST